MGRGGGLNGQEGSGLGVGVGIPSWIDGGGGCGGGEGLRG